MRKLLYRNCPLCGGNNPKVKYRRNYNLKEIKSELFSARRERKKKAYEHNAFCVCKNCGMVYSNPILDPSLVKGLYEKSKYNYSEEEKNLKLGYGAYLEKTFKYLEAKDRILDVGTGNGFLLDVALEKGFKKAFGIEPSKHAITSSKKMKNKKIVEDILKEKQFQKETFDLVCFFQIIDHIENPLAALNICHGYLKKNGILLCVSHDIDSLSTKIMGEKSPIFDIEHTHLFSKKTIRKMLEKAGFEVLEIGDAKSIFRIDYLIHLLPLSLGVKKTLRNFLKKMRLGEKSIKLKPGNFYAIAKKS